MTRAIGFRTAIQGMAVLAAAVSFAALPGTARAALILDPVGDFLPTYTGPHDAGLDVIAHEVVLAADRIIFFGRMAGPVAPTQAVGGLYITGVDRGQGTARFLNGTPIIGPNVLWDLIVRINPDGTGLVNNQVGGVVTQLDATDISISGNEYTASVPLSLFSLGATRPPEQWTYNLWPRNGLVPGQNVHWSDLAPDNGNSPVVPEPSSVLALAGLGAVALRGFGRTRRQSHIQVETVYRQRRFYQARTFA